MNDNLSAELDHAAARQDDDVVMARTLWQWLIVLVSLIGILGSMGYAAWRAATWS